MNDKQRFDWLAKNGLILERTLGRGAGWRLRSFGRNVFRVYSVSGAATPRQAIDAIASRQAAEIKSRAKVKP